MNKVHQYKGYDIRRGSYYGIIDDRADRWCIDDPDSKTLDRRGGGYRTLADAKAEIDEWEKNRMVYQAKELSQLLLNKFGSWVGTPSEELLEDGGHVIDHLTDDGRHDRDELNSIPAKVWEMAWNYFNQAVGWKN